MTKILIYSSNAIGKSMAGGAIRSWEFAKALAADAEVVLICPNEPDLVSEDFKLISCFDPLYQKQFENADILIIQRLTFPIALLAKRHKVKVIIDAYVPGPLELLEHFKGKSLKPNLQDQGKVFSEISNLILSFKMADGILCASEKQKNLWTGFLLGQKIISPSLYEKDPNLQQLMAIVPFGLSSIPPKKTGQGPREKFQLKENDKVLIWGGGIWNWFDPLSLIEAIAVIEKKRSDVKLVFMGISPPDPNLPHTAMSAQAVRLAEELGVANRSVFFNPDWIPYEERENWLLDANMGVSTHFEHLETVFSFRTRILDYLWAKLPILTTEGDAFAELIEKCQLGIVVPYQNSQAIAHAILDVIDDSSRLQAMRESISRVQEQFYWANVTEPLKAMIKRLQDTPYSRSSWEDGRSLCELMRAKIRERGFLTCVKAFYEKILAST